MIVKTPIGLLSAVLSICAFTPLADASAAPLKVGGTGSVTELLNQLAPVFEAETGIVLQVVPSLGTSGGNAAVADGVLGLAIAGRDLNAKEAARGLTVAATLHTPFGLATSRKGPDGLKSGEIAALYRADKPVWSDGTAFVIILRPTNESDNAVLGGLFPGMAESIQQLRKRSDLSVAATDQDNAEMGEKIKGSLIGMTLTQITTEKRNLRFVSIDGVAPSLAALQDGSYPYGKNLYVVVPSLVSPEGAAFMAFLGKPAAQSLLRKAGIVAGAK